MTCQPQTVWRGHQTTSSRAFFCESDLGKRIHLIAALFLKTYTDMESELYK